MTRKKKYTDEFKLQVVKDYYNSPLGVRAIASKYELPSKNYVNRWETALKRKGLLPPNATKPIKAAGRTKDAILYKDERTPREKQYAKDTRGRFLCVVVPGFFPLSPMFVTKRHKGTVPLCPCVLPCWSPCVLVSLKYVRYAKNHQPTGFSLLYHGLKPPCLLKYL
ncbi:MAG: transposase [Euryarchaeota archaeon]|nr:transposase [Euryarchaeota archaeon]